MIYLNLYANSENRMNLLCKDLNQYQKDTKHLHKGNEVDLQIEIECCKNKNMKQK